MSQRVIAEKRLKESTHTSLVKELFRPPFIKHTHMPSVPDAGVCMCVRIDMCGCVCVCDCERETPFIAN